MTDRAILRRLAQVDSSAAVGTLEVDVVVCTATADALDGDVWVIPGIDLERFRAHPIVLWDHDTGQPIGRACNLRASPSALKARVTFPPEGASPKADEIRSLVKAGIITGVSAGIIPIEVEPLDPRNPRGGRRIVRSELLEFSIVAVPADAAAGVTARSAGLHAAQVRSTHQSIRATALRRKRVAVYNERNPRA